MTEVLDRPRTEMSPYAPRLTQITIDSDFIGAVIGPGGKVVQGIQRETGTTIEIEERDGVGYVTVAATNQENAEAALRIIKGIVTVPEEGEEYEGTVRDILSFGAIIEILPGKEGMLHVSEMDYGYVERPEDYVQVGDKIRVKLIEVRDDGKLRLSRKPFLPKPENGAERPERERGERDGRPRGRDGGGRDGGRRHGGGGGGHRRSGGGGGRGGRH
jgi:polyribonucleotide nucleotidyltransferase